MPLGHHFEVWPEGGHRLFLQIISDCVRTKTDCIEIRAGLGRVEVEVLVIWDYLLG